MDPAEIRLIRKIFIKKLLRLGFYILQGFKNALWKKIIINGQMRNKPYLIVIYHSSLVKAAMNAARVYKLRNGVNKTP